jgi:sulfite reductase (ferredoxin)
MCSPLSGVCKDELFDATPYALAVAKFLLRNPLNQALPRKFKFNFTCCEKHGMIRIVDVGLLPQIRQVDGEIQKGFKIFLGGGLGNKSFVGHELEEFTPVEDFLYTSIAVLRIFDRLGDRKNLARNRMRYLVNDMGWKKFQNLVLKERAIVKATQSVIVKLRVDESSKEITRPISISNESTGHPDGFERWKKTNVFKQKQANYNSIFIGLESGDITANQLRTIAQITRDFSGEGLARNGFSQNIVIRYVHDDDLINLYSTLIESGLAKTGSLTMASAVGCSGTTSCNLALTNSHRLAKEIQRKFLELKFDEDDDLRDSTIKISGCPNSCGQHEIATIGLYGGGARFGKDMYPNYVLSLGGRFDGQSMLGHHTSRVPVKRVIPVILKIIELFKKYKKSDDSLSKWIDRIVHGNESSEIKSVEDIKKIIAPLLVPPTKDDDADFYSDYGSDTSYHTITGKGECAA